MKLLSTPADISSKDVPPGSFRPAPKVGSAIVRMIPLPGKDMLVSNAKLFAEIVAAAFGQRRKTMRNTLKNYLDESGNCARRIWE